MNAQPAQPIQMPQAAPRIAPVSRPATGASVFLPMMLMSIAIVGWFGLQAAQLGFEHQQLRTMATGLEPQVQTATTLRASLDGVATATARLAAAGNANAQVIVEELRKRGVTINAAGAAPK